jgi:hypothetical protein
MPRDFLIPGLAAACIRFFSGDQPIVSAMNRTPHLGDGRILVGAVLHMFVDSS